MAVIVQYIVERNGVQKMTFADKKEADQYDKMLDIADNLFDFIGESEVAIDDEALEAVSLFLAQNNNQLQSILKGSKPKKPKAKDETTKDETSTEKATKDQSETAETTATTSDSGNVGAPDETETLSTEHNDEYTPMTETDTAAA